MVVCGHVCAHGGSAGSIYYTVGRDFSLVTYRKGSETYGSDPFSSVSMERAFLAEGTVRVKVRGLGSACQCCRTNTGPSVAAVGKEKGRMLREEVREGAAGLDHVGFKLQPQPRLQILHLEF